MRRRKRAAALEPHDPHRGGRVPGDANNHSNIWATFSTSATTLACALSRPERPGGRTDGPQRPRRHQNTPRHVAERRPSPADLSGRGGPPLRRPEPPNLGERSRNPLADPRDLRPACREPFPTCDSAAWGRGSASSIPGVRAKGNREPRRALYWAIGRRSHPTPPLAMDRSRSAGDQRQMGIQPPDVIRIAGHNGCAEPPGEERDARIHHVSGASDAA